MQPLWCMLGTSLLDVNLFGGFAALFQVCLVSCHCKRIFSRMLSKVNILVNGSFPERYGNATKESRCAINQHGGWSCCRFGFPFSWPAFKLERLNIVRLLSLSSAKTSLKRLGRQRQTNSPILGSTNQCEQALDVIVVIPRAVLNRYLSWRCDRGCLKCVQDSIFSSRTGDSKRRLIRSILK